MWYRDSVVEAPTEHLTRSGKSHQGHVLFSLLYSLYRILLHSANIRGYVVTAYPLLVSHIGSIPFIAVVARVRQINSLPPAELRDICVF